MGSRRHAKATVEGCQRRHDELRTLVRGPAKHGEFINSKTMESPVFPSSMGLNLSASMKKHIVIVIGYLAAITLIYLPLYFISLTFWVAFSVGCAVSIVAAEGIALLVLPKISFVQGILMRWTPLLIFNGNILLVGCFVPHKRSSDFGEGLQFIVVQFVIQSVVAGICYCLVSWRRLFLSSPR